MEWSGWEISGSRGDSLKSNSGVFSIDQFRDEGYTEPVPLLTPEEAAAARRAFYAAIGQSEESPGPNNDRTGGFNLRYRWAYDLATNEKVLDHVEKVLGPDIVLWATVFWYKEPHNTKYIPWHQDASYWPMEPRINLTAWIALGPTFPKNGCLRLIPGSHKDWLDDEYQPLDNDSQFSRGLSAAQVDESKAVDMSMQPGEVTFFSEATLHGSNNNGSDVARLGFSSRFTIPEVKFDVEGLKEQNIDYLARTTLVRGEDKYHYNDAIRADPPAE